MPDNHFSRKKRQLKRSVKRLNLLLEKKDSKLNIEINKLITKVNSLLKQLSGLIDGREIRKILGGLIVFFGISFNAEAQNFASPVPKPDIAPILGGYYSPSIDFCDIDNDGDYDLFNASFSYYYITEINFQQNVGSPSSEVFSIPIQNQFNIEPFLDTININSQGFVGTRGLALDIEFADIDSDGDYDLFCSGIVSEKTGTTWYNDTSFASIFFYENIGDGNAPNFSSPILNPFGLDAGAFSYYVAPIELVDIDNDGDLDLISVEYSYGNYYFDLVFRENIGSSTSPQFATTTNNLAVGPFGIPIQSIDAVDINNDGDFDLFGAAYGGSLFYFENSGSSSSPNFSPPANSPFNLSSFTDTSGRGSSTLIIEFCDIDDDGDEDFFWIAADSFIYTDSSWFFQENISLPSNTNQIYIDENIEIYPNPSNNYITILYDKEIDKIKIYDISGKCILISDDKRINIENLENGIYSLELINKEGITRKKFIKE